MPPMAAEAEALNSAAEAAAAATEAAVTPASPKAEAYEQKEEEEEEEAEEEDGDDEEVWSSSDSEIGDALDWLDSRDGTTGGPDASAAFSLASRRPNAHGGLLSRPLQPISNRTQKISGHIRAAPLEEWEGRMNVGMSNSVTTAIRESVRDMAIGRTKTTEKADRATVEQAIDPRTRMVLFKMLNRGVFHDINGCISTGKEANVYHATKGDGLELAIKGPPVLYLIGKLGCHSAIQDKKMKQRGILHLIYWRWVDNWRYFEEEKTGLDRFSGTEIDMYKVIIVSGMPDVRYDNLLKLMVPLISVGCLCDTGKGGWAAPRLKDAALSEDKLRESYVEFFVARATGGRRVELYTGTTLLEPSNVQDLYESGRPLLPYNVWKHKFHLSHGDGKVTNMFARISAMNVNSMLQQLSFVLFLIIITMRKLYQKCKLVHGDLSEYNILYFEGHLYIIDVSQSVDLDHPHALDFLREDCLHDFFRKHGVAVMTVRELFDFIVDPSITDESVDSYLEKIQQKILERGSELTAEDEIAESSFIPRRLTEVKDYEKDIDRITGDKDTEGIYYQTITGLSQVLSRPSDAPAVSTTRHQEDAMENDHEKSSANPVSESNSVEVGQGSETETAEGNSSESDSEGNASGRDVETKSPVDKRAARKEHKKKVKEEKREARKTKVPKAVKKRKKKLAKANSKK
ncbi:hypothetical protein ACLOJK_013213 [Asimina triloba]